VTQIAGLDISASSLSKAATTLSEAFPSVEFLSLTVDLTHEAEVEKAIEAVVAKFGRIDYAVNNAAVGQKLSPTSETELAEYDRVLAVNLRAVFICEKYELRQMEKQEPLIPRDVCS
jgi:NAD(P)-dependent dehydrogenase (short-subunit alcohol dehydrogenase family)